MTYSSLLLHMEPGPEAEGRLHIACELAVRCDASLIGIDAASMNMPVMDPTGFAAIDPDLIDSERRALEAEFAETAARFSAAAATRNLRTKWYSKLEFPGDVICRQARAADLIIIGRGANASTISPQHAVDAGEILTRTGRPVLVVPPEQKVLQLNHVLVAWKDSREAQRAVADALGLLALAKSVTVLAVCPETEAEEGRDSATDIVAYLQGHKITADLDIRIAANETIGEEILRAAQDKGSDLIVSGAYGHGPVREWVFGGVTRDLLKKSPIACLLSH